MPPACLINLTSRFPGHRDDLSHGTGPATVMRGEGVGRERRWEGGGAQGYRWGCEVPWMALGMGERDYMAKGIHRRERAKG